MMSIDAHDNMTIHDLITAHPGGPYAENIAGPMHALLVAAERLVAAGYSFEDVKYAFQFFIEAEQMRQEQSRDD